MAYKWINIKKGEFVETKGIQSYVHDVISGHLVRITIIDNARYGPGLRLHIVNEHEYLIVGMNADSNPGKGFMMAVHEVDLLHPITLAISLKQGEKYPRNVLSIYQFGKLLSTRVRELNELMNDIRLKIIPGLQKKPNPFKVHEHYQPNNAGIQGGYFDAQAGRYGKPGPVGSEEKKYYEKKGGGPGHGGK